MQKFLALACLAIGFICATNSAQAFHGGGNSRYPGYGNVWGGYRGYQNWGPYGSANYPGHGTPHAAYPMYAGQAGVGGQPGPVFGQPGPVFGQAGPGDLLGPGTLQGTPVGPLCPNCRPQP
jgi:hypothetical protein